MLVPPVLWLATDVWVALLESALAAGRTRVATDDGALPPDYAESLAYVEELNVASQLTPPVLARFLRSGSRTSMPTRKSRPCW